MTSIHPRSCARAGGRALDPVAEWDFRSEPDALRTVAGAPLSLTVGGGDPRWVADPVTGGAVEFDGRHDHLIIPADAVGALDVARAGDTVTVVALVQRASVATGFIAGMWQEDDADPRRQYGLFLSLPTYGGSQQVNGHVSADGLPSDALPYSRDYSATARMVPLGTWRVIAFRYDGREITSYLDGLSDSRPEFTEVGPPLGAGRSYRKNPYDYPRGLNRGAVSDFTIGAVRLSAGMGNHFAGRIARVAVFGAALSPAEVLALSFAWTPPGEPLISLDFHRPAFPVGEHEGGWSGSHWPVSVAGLRSDDDGPRLTPDGLLLPASGRDVLVELPLSAWPETAGSLAVRVAQEATDAPATARLDPDRRALTITRPAAVSPLIVDAVEVLRA